MTVGEQLLVITDHWHDADAAFIRRTHQVQQILPECSRLLI